MRQFVSLLSAFVLALVINTAAGAAQTTSIVTTGLTLPTKVIMGPHGSLLVSENGTTTANTGRVSVVDRTTGERHTLISGLPSAVDNLGGPPDPDGTTGIYLDGHLLYITSGVGDAVTNIGGAQYPTGTDSSPLFSSVMEVFLPQRFESLDSEFHMTMDDQNALAEGRWIRIRNQEGSSIFVRVVANLPDYRPDPTPVHPDAVRASHLFAVEKVGWNLFVVDASYNMIHKINLFTGNVTPFVEFPNRPNPLFGTIGPPTVEAVPTNIHRVGSHFLVSELTGFPFVPGLADVQSISLWDGTATPFVQGLSSAMDICPVRGPGRSMSYYTIEFSTNQLAGAPGRMQYIDGDGNRSVVVPTLITPSSMVRDERTGDIFVTNIYPGTITKVQF
ncbi:MAG: ScyD/ScyE family protein [Acidobacteria bacterium]|nr:ScyD/ScyE family protein [Acidobacteriota bacterium]